MMTGTVLEPWLVETIRRRAQEFAAQLRPLEDGTTPVPNLEWSVTELAQHVACLPSFWDGQHQRGDSFERPDNFAAYSDAARGHIDETVPWQLATRIEADFESFVIALTGCEEQRWLYGVKASASNMCGLALNELILHGRDLAQVTGAALPTFERREANVAVDANDAHDTVFRR